MTADTFVLCYFSSEHWLNPNEGTARRTLSAAVEKIPRAPKVFSAKACCVQSSDVCTAHNKEVGDGWIGVVAQKSLVKPSAACRERIEVCCCGRRRGEAGEGSASSD